MTLWKSPIVLWFCARGGLKRTCRPRKPKCAKSSDLLLVPIRRERNMSKKEVRIGMHASLWAAAWTREAAELAIPEAAEHGLEIIEFPLLEPDKVDAPHSRKLFDKYGIEPTASL